MIAPELVRPNILNELHRTASNDNQASLLHFVHETILANANEKTSFGKADIRAMNIGATAYEVIAAFNNLQNDFSPDRFTLPIFSHAEPTDFTSYFVSELDNATGVLCSQQPAVANVVYDVCLMHTENSSPLATRGLKAAALLHVTLEEVITQLNFRDALADIPIPDDWKF